MQENENLDWLNLPLIFDFMVVWIREQAVGLST